MRASLGFRAGPLYVGTGNLLRSKRRQHRGKNPIVAFTALYFLAMWLLVKWMFIGLWLGGVYSVRGGQAAYRAIKKR